MGDNLLTVKQAAERMQVSVTTVRRLVWSGELPHVRVGRAVRIKESDLQAYIDRLGKGERTGVRTHTTRQRLPVAGISSLA